MPPIRREVHYGARLLPSFVIRPANVDAMFRHAVAVGPDDLAVVDGDQRITYDALGGAVERIAANLARRGIGHGDRVAIVLGNRAAFVELCLACARLGAVSVPINIRQRRPENEYVLGHSGAVAVVSEAELHDQIPAPEAVPELRHRFVVGGNAPGAESYEALLAPGVLPPTARPPEEDEPFCILYTSGTTGRPKGAVLTHYGVVHSCLNFQHCMGLRAGDRAILAVPASHVTGLVAIVLSMIQVRGAVVMLPVFKARAYLELVASERVTYTVAVPAMYNLCLLDPDFERYDLSCWRIGGYGGAPMPQATIKLLAQKLPNLMLFNAYGATETTSPATIMPPGQGVAYADTVGKVVPCCDIRVVDEDGREVPPGGAGELWIGGANVVPGYWNNSDADAANFLHGYWRSGDVGSIDADGFVRVFDRKKDMINRAGYKVYSAEVENVLSHCPGILEAAVVGRPDDVLGERVQAFVVRTDDRLSESDIRAFCAERLSDYKVPDRITFLADPLPRNANGKVLKPELRKFIDVELRGQAAQESTK